MNLEKNEQNNMGWKENNEQVLKDVSEKRNVIKHILKRKTKLIGHLFRYNTYMKNIFEGKILGKDLEDAQEHHISKTSNISWRSQYIQNWKTWQKTETYGYHDKARPLNDDDDDLLNSSPYKNKNNSNLGKNTANYLDK
jgi:hypothetical protein